MDGTARREQQPLPVEPEWAPRAERPADADVVEGDVVQEMQRARRPSSTSTRRRRRRPRRRRRVAPSARHRARKRPRKVASRRRQRRARGRASSRPKGQRPKARKAAKPRAPRRKKEERPRSYRALTVTPGRARRKCAMMMRASFADPRWTDVDDYFIDTLRRTRAAARRRAAAERGGRPACHQRHGAAGQAPAPARVAAVRRATSSKSARWAATARCGWLGRSSRAAGSSRSSTSRATPRSRARHIRLAGLSSVVDLRVGAALDILPGARGGTRPGRSTSPSSTPTSPARPRTSTGRSSCRAPAR